MVLTSEQTIGPEQFYFNNLEVERFMIQRCNACERAVFYPRNVCPHCGGRSLIWFEPSGEGTVYATTTVHPGREGGEPYNVCLVDLDEGVRLMACVVDAATDRVRIGKRVSARVDKQEDGAKVVFVLKDGG